MTAAVTTTLDASRLRVGVDLSGWATDGSVAVNRVHSDGQRYPVRGMSNVSGGVAFGWDYETPLSQAFTYEANDSVAGTVASDPVTLSVGFDVATLTAPGLPTLGGQVTPAAKPSVRRPRPVVQLDILGRSAPIVKSDGLKAPSFTLEVHTLTHSDADVLTSLLVGSPVMLLRMPGTRVTDWCYVSVVGDVEERPGVFYKDRPDSGRSDGEFVTWTIPCQVVDRPEGGVYGDPTSTWQALKDTGMTWQQLRDSGMTWLDVLRGVG